MPQSLSQIWVHIIFSTKHREPMLNGNPMQKEVHAYLSGICKKMESPALSIGGMPDHVHILSNLSKNISLQDLVQNLKQSSSKWIKRQWPDLDDFYWQGGYGAFSVSPLHLGKVQKYIANQEKHHREFDFQDEFRMFLERYRVSFDNRFLWD